MSKKQKSLLHDIISQNVNEIYVQGSTQSGKTYDICLALILYAQELYQYDSKEDCYGAIIGWTITTLKGNIVEVLQKDFEKLGLKKNIDYKMKWGSADDEKYIKIYNIKFFFFGFNNVLSFNKILGKPLIFVWVDESARIYSQAQLQDQFDQLPGRQMSYVNHPYQKTIHSFNSEGNENHPYKLKYIDGKPDALHYTFFPYDNPKLNTPEAIRKAVEMFPKGSALQRQKVFNEWCVAEGKVFDNLNVISDLSRYAMREIGIGIDYGSVNPTTFVPIALCFDNVEKRWVLIRLQTYFHDPKIMNDKPTTEYYSKQLRLFIVYLKLIYPHVPITTIVIDSEASHFDNRLTTDNIPHLLSDKTDGVDKGVQHLQALIYKKYFYILQSENIREINENLTPRLSGKDDSKMEFDSYQYDNIKSLKEGKNCYKKENDHSIDATRYIIKEFANTGRCPIV